MLPNPIKLWSATCFVDKSQIVIELQAKSVEERLSPPTDLVDYSLELANPALDLAGIILILAVRPWF